MQRHEKNKYEVSVHALVSIPITGNIDEEIEKSCKRLFKNKVISTKNVIRGYVIDIIKVEYYSLKVNMESQSYSASSKVFLLIENFQKDDKIVVTVGKINDRQYIFDDSINNIILDTNSGNFNKENFSLKNGRLHSSKGVLKRGDKLNAIVTKVTYSNGYDHVLMKVFIDDVLF